MTESKLVLISERARMEPLCRFTCLAHLLDVEFLKSSYHELGKDRASGVDGVSWREYGERLEENLEELVIRMKAKQYRPQPSLRVYIPKDEKTMRALGLPALEDKIVQKGIAIILGAIYEPDFLECSYGFRKGHGCHQALKEVNTMLTIKRINHVIEADIKGFFDHVSHEWMMKLLEKRIGDPSLLLLIRRFLKAGYMEKGAFVETEEGTPQGGNLSPMLSNIFLHYVLDEWFEKTVKTQMRGECRLVRYADDFICMLQYQDESKDLQAMLSRRFSEFGLELHPEKTRTMSFGRYEKENADRQNRKANTFDFLGFTHFCGQNRRGGFLLGRKTSGKKVRRRCAEMKLWLKSVRNSTTLKEWWPVLASKLRGHYEYYGVSGNYLPMLRYYGCVVSMAEKWLNRRSQLRSMTKEKFHAYMERYPLPKPKIRHSFYDLEFVS